MLTLIILCNILFVVLCSGVIAGALWGHACDDINLDFQDAFILLGILLIGIANTCNPFYLL